MGLILKCFGRQPKHSGCRLESNSPDGSTTRAYCLWLVTVTSSAIPRPPRRVSESRIGGSRMWSTGDHHPGIGASQSDCKREGGTSLSRQERDLNAATILSIASDPDAYASLSRSTVITASEYLWRFGEHPLPTPSLRHGVSPMPRDLEDLRVAFIVGTLGQGGAERQLYYILEALRASGARPRVLCLTHGEFWEDRIRALGVDVRWVGMSSSRLARLRAIVLDIRREPVAVIQSQHFYTNV